MTPLFTAGYHSEALNLALRPSPCWFLEARSDHMWMRGWDRGGCPDWTSLGMWGHAVAATQKVATPLSTFLLSILLKKFTIIYKINIMLYWGFNTRDLNHEPIRISEVINQVRCEAIHSQAYIESSFILKPVELPPAGPRPSSLNIPFLPVYSFQNVCLQFCGFKIHFPTCEVNKSCTGVCLHVHSLLTGSVGGEVWWKRGTFISSFGAAKSPKQFANWVGQPCGTETAVVNPRMLDRCLSNDLTEPDKRTDQSLKKHPKHVADQSLLTPKKALKHKDDNTKFHIRVYSNKHKRTSL